MQEPARYAEFGRLGRVCRLGLATRGNTRLDSEDVLEAIERGVNYLNWCGYADGLSRAVRQLGDLRGRVLVAVQLSSRSAVSARKELRGFLGELGTDRIDVVTHYYVESDEEWEEIVSPGGASEAIEEARACGEVGAAGVTSHQRPLAARIAASGGVDMLMVRYNAAHRGAEEEIFPVTRRLGLPVVTYTGLRWGALLEPTPEDPPDFAPPAAPEWYRFVLCHPDVTVGIMAPDGRAELEEDLQILDRWHGFRQEDYAALRAHGDRVYRNAGGFP